MANPVVTIQSAVKRLINAASPGDILAPQSPRLNDKFEIVAPGLYNGMQQSGVEGSLFTHMNAGSRGTGVALGSATGASYSATNSLFLIDNVNAPGGPDVVMDSMTILVDTIAGGAPTFWHWYYALDKAPRYSSGATASAINSMTTLNAQGASPQGVNVYSGVLVATAATVAAHDIGHNLLANGASVANTVYTVIFGAQERQSGTFTTPTTAVQQTTIYAPAVVVPPGYSFVINEAWVGRTTTSLIGELTATMIIR